MLQKVRVVKAVGSRSFLAFLPPVHPELQSDLVFPSLVACARKASSSLIPSGGAQLELLVVHLGSASGSSPAIVSRERDLKVGLRLVETAPQCAVCASKISLSRIQGTPAINWPFVRVEKMFLSYAQATILGWAIVH